MSNSLNHDLGSLRTLLEVLVQLDHEHEPVTPEKAAELEFAFRDCRLELLRLMPTQLTTDQKARLKAIDGRLNMVAHHGSRPDSIGPEAKRTLEAFGWTQPEE